VLIGKPASDFSIPDMPLASTPPAIPVGVPSDLLEAPAGHRCLRAERCGCECTNRRCRSRVLPNGHAQRLPWLGELESGEIILGGKSLLVLGASVSETVYDGGLRRAQTDFARAAYDATVATYRQTR